MTFEQIWHSCHTRQATADLCHKAADAGLLHPATFWNAAASGCSGSRSRTPCRAFTVNELLVVMAIVLVLSALMSVAISASQTSAKVRRTRAVIAKLEAIIGPQFDSYAGRNPVLTPNKTRGDVLREAVERDLPDSWEDVERLANETSDTATLKIMSPHQRAYVSIWNSIAKRGLTEQVRQSNGSAECLFMIVMQGGISDCLDCRMSRMDVGDQDRDTMPEFLDAWDRPIGFVLWPTGLCLPAGSTKRFFASGTSAPPFDSVMPPLGDPQGGLLRPLIFSMGPNQAAGIGTVCGNCGVELVSVAAASDQVCPRCGRLNSFFPKNETSCELFAASPLPEVGLTEASDNITNFDEVAR